MIVFVRLLYLRKKFPRIHAVLNLLNFTCTHETYIHSHQLYRYKFHLDSNAQARRHLQNYFHQQKKTGIDLIKALLTISCID